MTSKDEIISILDAVNEINLKPKKNIKKKIIISQNTIPKLNEDLVIPSDVDRIITEAEKYKILPIDSSKTFLNEKESKNSENEDIFILTDEIVINSNFKDKTIEELNKKVRSLEDSKKKLIAQITELNHKQILPSKISDNTYKQDNLNNHVDVKETLKNIYNQVEEQKKLFLDLKTSSSKIERDSNVYKENYERLVIENNDLKTRLKITKEQIVNYEKNKKDLLTALDQLNEILSKSNVVGKILPQNQLSDKKEVKKNDEI
jgi:hypothetical protein